MSLLNPRALRRAGRLAATTEASVATARGRVLAHNGTIHGTHGALKQGLLGRLGRRVVRHRHHNASLVPSLPPPSPIHERGRYRPFNRTQSLQLPARPAPLPGTKIRCLHRRVCRRSFSFYNDGPGSNYSNGSGGGGGQPPPSMGNAAYTVYGEEFAFSIRAILPEFRVLPSGMVVLDAGKRGRLLLEWTPCGGHNDENNNHSGRRSYRWDVCTRFALTAEEAASLLARLDRGDPGVEFTRNVGSDNNNNNYTGGGNSGPNIQKVFLAKNIGAGGGDDGSRHSNDGVSLLVDYVDAETQRFGETPHGNDGTRGPFEIRLMVGEYNVLRSIIEYSIPKLVGWSTMLDANIEQAVAKIGSGSYGAGRRGGGGQNNGGGDSSSPHGYNQ